MATPTPKPTATKLSRPPASAVKKTPYQRNAGTLFTKDNIKWMMIGGALIILGFILMSGGKSEVDVFGKNGVYSPMRITIAPILILAGLGVMVYAIMKKPKNESETTA